MQAVMRAVMTTPGCARRRGRGGAGEGGRAARERTGGRAVRRARTGGLGLAHLMKPEIDESVAACIGGVLINSTIGPLPHARHTRSHLSQSGEPAKGFCKWSEVQWVDWASSHDKASDSDSRELVCREAEIVLAAGGAAYEVKGVGAAPDGDGGRRARRRVKGRRVLEH